MNEGDPGTDPGANPFVAHIAVDDRERAAYFALRRSIFCEEQGLFAGDDRD